MSTENYLDNILSTLSSELKSSKGFKKENIYKADVFKGLVTSDEKKTQRRKLRNVIDNFLSTYRACKTDKIKLESLKKDFLKYYNQVYSINNFEVDSIASKNTDSAKREALSEMLNAFKIVEKTKVEKPNK